MPKQCSSKKRMDAQAMLKHANERCLSNASGYGDKETRSRLSVLGSGVGLSAPPPHPISGASFLRRRWTEMLAGLSGQSLPALPSLPGRIVVAPPIPTPAEDAAAFDTAARDAAAWRALASDSEGGDLD